MLDAQGNQQFEAVTSPTSPTGATNEQILINPFGGFFTEEFYGNSWKPRITAGIGVNWNSPFGPFRIDLAYALSKQLGDQTKTLSFNVGTQF